MSTLKNERKLLQQISSGCGTQQNCSKDEPTYADTSELQAIYHPSVLQIEAHPVSMLHRNNSEPMPSFSYLDYDVKKLPRSRSYQKSLENIAQRNKRNSLHEHQMNADKSVGHISMISNSHQSDVVEAPKSSITCIANETMPISDHSLLRVPSDQSLNTLSNDHDEVFTQPNLRDELLSCDQKDLFQFLNDDFDNSHNYFSDTVGYGSAVIDPDTDSLIFDSKRDDNIFSPVRKTSTASNKSNLSYISNSIFEALEHTRGGSISESVDRRSRRQKQRPDDYPACEEREPLVKDSEFENIIASFEKELTNIKNSTPSLARKLSTGSHTSDGKVKSPFEISSSTHTYEEILPMRSNTANSHRNSVKLKRRSLEKQMKVDDGFSVSNEIKKICDHMQAPFTDSANSSCLIISPKTRRKNTNFHSSFDRIKRASLIERVDESIEDERQTQVQSEHLPRKQLKADINIESISLKSTGSYEKLVCHRDNKDEAKTDTNKEKNAIKDVEKQAVQERSGKMSKSSSDQKGTYFICTFF